MGKDSQNEKRSFLKTGLGGFVARLRKGSRKSNNATSAIAEAEESVVQSVVADPLTHHEQKCKESGGLGKDLLIYDPEEHVEPVKREKAIRHIEKLLERISQLQIDIDNALNRHISLEKEISNLMSVSEKSSHQIPQRKQVKARRKQKANELSVTEKSVRKRRKRSQENAKKDNSPQNKKSEVRKKLCLRCKKKKSESNFHKDKSCKDGLARWCKECKAKAARKYRKKKTVKIKHTCS